MTDFTRTRDFFDIPQGMIYLDGNSLGPVPKTAAGYVARTITEDWGKRLIKGWNEAGWMAAPSRVGDRIARLIGAESGSVVVGDTLSVKVFQALAAALKLNPGRKVILSDTGNFPSDLYMAQGLLGLLPEGYSLQSVPPEAVLDALSEDVAVLMLTEVDYRTGRLHDMATLTAAAHACGILTVWDLAHSAGAIEVDVAAAGADFAVGCTYKYLNAGPGAPAFIYVAPRHVNEVQPALAGWLGHAAPFAFEPAYRAGGGIERMRVGTPPVLQIAALEAALDIWEGVALSDIRKASIALSERFLARIEATCPDLKLVSPRDPLGRGSQLSFAHPHGYAVMQALIAENVIGDFRAPDLLRFGFTPLYLSQDDIDHAADVLADILRSGRWNRPEFHTRKAVT